VGTATPSPVAEKHVAIKIDADLHRRAWAAAAYKGQKWHTWLEEAIATEVERQEQERFEDERRRRGR
jgi:predicted HicB family RNase H-like nuclease